MFAESEFAGLAFSELSAETAAEDSYQALLEDVDAFDVFLVELEPYQLEPEA